MKQELINKKLLEEQIEDIERGYVEAVVTEIKTPVFIALCEKAKTETDDKERLEQLNHTIESHKRNLNITLESMASMEQIIPNLKSLCSQL